MILAEIYFWQPIKSPKAILVFCPGHNGNGETFTRENDYALCGLSFASQMSLGLRDMGYPYTDRGSGYILLRVLDEKLRKK